jgi:hypothetical protein
MDSEPSKAPAALDVLGQPRMVGAKRWVARRDCRTISQVGRLAPYSRATVHNSTMVNLERALKERVYFVKGANGEFVPPPSPISGAFDDCDPIFGEVSRRCARFPSLTLDSFPGRYKDAKKRSMYERAVETLHSTPISRKDAHITGFVKADKLDLAKKSDPVPRLISSYGARYVVSLGRHYAHREHSFIRALDKTWGSRVVCKGLNSRRRGELIAFKWGRFRKPCALMADASRFDQHVSMEALRKEFAFYLTLGTCPAERKEMEFLLNLQLIGGGTGLAEDGKVKFKTHGGRKSGVPNTGGGNTLLMCVMFLAYVRSLDLDCEFVNDGDDCVLIMEQADRERVESTIQGYFLSKGFTMVVEKAVFDLEHIDFCQGSPIWTPSGYIMVRRPQTSLVKDTISLDKFESERHWKRWMASVADCGLSLAGGIPVVQEFYQCLGRASAGVKRFDRGPGGGLEHLSRGMRRRYADIHECTRYSFWLAFGITPPEQLAAERLYSGVCLTYGDNLLVNESLVFSSCI